MNNSYKTLPFRRRSLWKYGRRSEDVTKKKHEPFKAQWLFCVPPGLTLKKKKFCSQRVFIRS